MFQEELEMYDVQIRRSLLKDIQLLNDFFEFVITDTFIKEGIGNKLDHIQKEMECKKKYLKADFESNGKKRYFLIAFIIMKNNGIYFYLYLKASFIILLIHKGDEWEIIMTCLIKYFLSMMLLHLSFSKIN